MIISVELLDDPEVDAVYNPVSLNFCSFHYLCIDPYYSKLPNGLHFEWTMKALAAGKHVLLEKPSANTADETRQMFELAERKGLVLLEAVHYRCVLSNDQEQFVLSTRENVDSTQPWPAFKR
jgi:hypothetical protein